MANTENNELVVLRVDNDSPRTNPIAKRTEFRICESVSEEERIRLVCKPCEFGDNPFSSGTIYLVEITHCRLAENEFIGHSVYVRLQG